MSLRTQLTLLCALAVAAAVVIVSLVAYFATQDRLLSQIDATLHDRVGPVASAEGLPEPGAGGGDGGRGGEQRDPFANTDTFFQVINQSGAVVAAPQNQQLALPVSDRDRAVAGRTSGAYTHDVTVSGVHLRMLTSPGRDGQAVQVARSLADVEASLRGLRWILIVVSAIGVAVAAVAGLLVARRALRPVAHLTAAAEHVAETQELAAAIDVHGTDEVARLGRSFNAMLAALSASREQQQQLARDASHELRTPLTSLRTNIEILARADDMPPGERKELLRHATLELEELTKLVSELVELAADQRVAAHEFVEIRLDELARAVVDRAARRTGARFDVATSPTLIVGNPTLVERAAGNLLDNAAKWSPPGSSIEVTAENGTFSVRDHGPGIDAADLPHVFDRFYRAQSARSKPGSGLGLAIVRQIAEAHGGHAWVERAAGGGTIAGFALPIVEFGSSEPSAESEAEPSPSSSAS